MPLGFEPSLLLNDPAGREFRAAMARNLENVGKQVQESIKTIVTNREVRAFGEQLRTIDPNSPTFAQDLVGAIDEHPMGATSKQGILAINLLGAQHKNWLRDQNEQERQFAVKPVAGGRGFYDQNTGEFIETPAEMLPADKPNVRNVQGGLAELKRDPATGELQADFLIPPPDKTKSADPTKEIKRLQAHHNTLYDNFRMEMRAANDADKAATAAEAGNLRELEGMSNEQKRARAAELRRRAEGAAERANKIEREMQEVNEMIQRIAGGGFAETGVTESTATGPEALIPEIRRPSPPVIPGRGGITPPARLRYNPQTGNFE